MKYLHSSIFLLLIALSVGVLPLNASANFFKTRSDEEVLKGKEDGFFFYIDPKTEEEKKEEEEKKKLADTEIRIDWENAHKMHPKEMNAKLEELRDLAIQNPTQERVTSYITLQQVAVDKASEFQQAWTISLLENPILNESAKRPATGFVSKLQKVTKVKEMEEAIEHMRADMGIMFFYTDDCSHCDEQKKILANFGEKREWDNIVGINLSKEPKLIKQYNVQIVPDIWVVGNLDGEVKQRRISTGISTGTQIERGLMNAYSQWFKGKDYNPEMYTPLTEFEDYIKTLPSTISAPSKEQKKNYFDIKGKPDLTMFEEISKQQQQ